MTASRWTRICGFREAISLVFSKFTEFQSIRQVHLWLRQEEIQLPAVEYGEEERRIVWKQPVYNTVHHILTNPIYAGGRTRLPDQKSRYAGRRPQACREGRATRTR